MEKKPLTPWALITVGAASVLGLGLVWQLSVSVLGINPYVLPPPSKVLETALRERFLVADVLVSTRRVLVGFVMAVVIATPIGLVMGINRWVRAAASPILSLVRPLPSMSWIPLSIIWFGLGEQQKYTIVFMGCFASVLVYTVEATVQVDPDLRRAARNLGASPLQEVFLVILPAALPSLLSGLKVIMAIAWTCVISPRWSEPPPVWVSRSSRKEIGSTSLVFVGMLCISVTVLVLDVVFRGFEWLLLPYRRERR